ncbi:LacI family transcriptional regulator [Diaminobutyricimonas aerilata]|uniref:LacI family transcriptional regulator n=1 Tax=Diaminobutyricimonas aerilata TaxID=1162967 RepID=A0A2M9CFN3_9MICO|nr:LacI family DNA-binding transcriptional regulator [Diaminobutyricimonas aerilata]PJJ70655.1 LacI family transcriptional regulator [Diaminobutyricimonas aerilata]
MSNVTGRKFATIEDVARHAGVSRAAVSKVIRGAYGVSDTMRERVNSSIAELNYRPRVAARAMRGSSFTLGIEIPEFGNPFFIRILKGATEAIAGTDYQLIIAPADAGIETDAVEGYRALEALADRQVDGIVAVSPLVQADWLARLAERTPVVMLGRHDDASNYDRVVGDDAVGAALVMDHLFSLGHERIAHVTRSEAVTFGNSTPHAIRLGVYERMMRAAGHGSHVEVVRTGPTERHSFEATRALLQTPNRPTAIFAAHDELALGALRAVGALGLTAAEVSVIGYDDIDLADHPAISLTTVDQAGVEMGRQAVRLLIEQIAGRSEPVEYVSTPTLKVRGSTAPVRRRSLLRRR